MVPNVPDPAAPRLCVGLPVHNGERFLEETLESILAQTFDDFELVVSDNASSDATPRIIRDHAARDDRIRVIRHERNVGASANFDAVWQECRSELFKWVAADDPCGPQFFAACIDALDAHPDAGLAYPRAAFIGESSEILYPFDDLVTLPQWSTDRFVRSRQVIDALLEHGSTANVMVFGVMRADVLRAVGPIGNYFGADLPFVARIAMSAEVVEVADTLSFFRRHEGSSSSYTRSPSAAGQQKFYDPSVRGRVRLQWNLRRRYFELMRISASVPVGWRRPALVATVLGAIARRLVWRIRFEIHMMRNSVPPGPVWSGEPTHWSDFRPDE